MKTDYLLPNRYKKIGWIIFVPAVLLGFITLVFQFEPSFLDVKLFALVDSSPFGDTNYLGLTETNALDEVLSVLIIIGSLLVAFSKTKNEDEYITKIRLESLVWAIYVNYIILLVCIIFLYNYAFFYALVVNIFTVLLCFVARFYWKVYTMPGGKPYEK